MKISEMNTEQFVVFVSKAAVPVGNIAGDVEFSKAVLDYGKKVPRGTPFLLAMSRAVDIFVPLLLGKHSDDFYSFTAALLNKKVSELKKQNCLKTMQEIKDSFDQELISFFMPSVK